VRDRRRTMPLVLVLISLGAAFALVTLAAAVSVPAALRSSTRASLPEPVMIPAAAVVTFLAIRAARRWRARTGPRITVARAATRLAVAVAGTRHAALGREWPTLLTGDPGAALGSRRRAALVGGFVRAAIRLRCRDLGDSWWKHVGDPVLKSRTWSNAVILLPTAFAASLVFSREGLCGVAANYQSLAGVPATLYLAIDRAETAER
jgi:hypothetical protein